MTELGPRLLCVVGVAAALAIAWGVSLDRRHPPWRVIGAGLALQLVVALALLKTELGALLFRAASWAVLALAAPARAGARFVFGGVTDGEYTIAFHVLPTIVFLGSLFAVLDYLGLIRVAVRAMAAVMGRALHLSGAESLAATANLFLGMIEAPLCIRPYLEGMTRSELFTVMAVGMSTVAGSVLVVYAELLGSDYAGHLVTASLIAAPGGVILAKLMVPERDTPATAAGAEVARDGGASSLIDAAAQGAGAGLRLAAYIGATLIAFVALVALVNQVLGGVGRALGAPELSLQLLLGYAFSPLAVLLGLPGEDIVPVASLLGTKTVLNEFLAYRDLAAMVEAGAIGARSATLASYALCGFANLGSLAILLGGLGALAPSRRSEIATLGPRSLLAGVLATFGAACIAGIVL